LTPLKKEGSAARLAAPAVSFAALGEKPYNANRGIDRPAFLHRFAVGTAKGVPALLSEQEVTRSWSVVFKGAQFEADSFDRAEQLLEELRPESPLRLRLTQELEELRKIHISRATVSA
jgi:hypothetical protein